MSDPSYQDMWYGENLSRQYKDEMAKRHNEWLKRHNTLLKNQDARRADYEARADRWLAMDIPNYIVELQVSYERHIEIRRMRDVAGMTLAAIGTRVSLSTERVRQIYLSKKHKKTPPVVKWLVCGECADLARLASMGTRGKNHHGQVLLLDEAVIETYKSLRAADEGE